MSNFFKIPTEMQDIKAWLLWHKFPQQDGTYKKVPDEFSWNGKTWETINLLSFNEANIQLNVSRSEGIGIAFTKTNGIAGIDIDNAIRPDGEYNMKIMEKVWPVIKQAQKDGCYIETSVSGTGYHIYGNCTIKDKLLSLFGTGKMVSDNVEIYFADAYFTVSGNPYSGSWGCIDNAIREAYKIIQKEKPVVTKEKASPKANVPQDDKIPVPKIQTPYTQNNSVPEDEFTDSDVLQLPGLSINTTLRIMSQDKRKKGAYVYELLQSEYPENVNESDFDMEVLGVLVYWLYRFGAVEICKVFESSALFQSHKKKKSADYAYNSAERAFNNAEKFFPAVNYKKLNPEQTEKLKRWVTRKEREA